MGTYRRINVASGRSLEKLAHYSRAVRVGDMVLQSGTTAIDRRGDVRGVGDVAKQVETIMTIAEWSVARAGGTLGDVVRSRIYVTDIGVGADAGRALARYFRDVRPAASSSRSSSTRSTAPGPRRDGSRRGGPSRTSTHTHAPCARASASTSQGRRR